MPSRRPTSHPVSPSRVSAPSGSPAPLAPAPAPAPAPPPPALAIDPDVQVISVIDLTAESDTDRVSDDGSGPPAKRPCLDTRESSTPLVPLDNNNQYLAIHQQPLDPQHNTPSTASEVPESINPMDLMNHTPNEQSLRPPWSFRSGMSSSAARRASESSQWSPSTGLPLLPIRPWQYSPQERSPHDTPTAADAPKDDTWCLEVQTTPYRMFKPTKAPRFPDNKLADFSPWTGSQVEDVLSEHTIKHGFYDRVQVSPNESVSARSTLYPQFKHRSGLKVLSSVFAASLEQRQNHNRVTAPSTFRPPPRVTLTDNKRETWLRDLANDSVPLRRLSRTIPHGVRGKVLLEHCLVKSVHISRALWVAKCVGANELRAFRRKGTSATVASGLEAKWVRDWTVNVQQFIEGVLGSLVDEGWKIRLCYALRLTGRLFLEYLVDHDHFMEWFHTSSSKASLASFPVWLLMLGSYWDHVVKYRKRGKRLAECLLEKLSTAILINKNGHLNSLIRRLSRFIKKIVRHCPSSFILPRCWAKYETTLSSCLDMNSAEDKKDFASLQERNASISRAKVEPAPKGNSPLQHIIELLDSSSDIPTLATDLLNLSLDPSTVATTVLEWASTAFRYGTSRTYTAVRLFRRWRRIGMDTDLYLFTFLAQAHQKSGVRLVDLYHIICELVRSQTFSVSKYLQWLIARGALSRVSENKERMPGDIGLLSNLPSCRLPGHVWNLRNTLLSRTGFQVDLESEIIEVVKQSIQRRLPTMFPEVRTDADVQMTDDLDLSAGTWTVKCEIGQWLRDVVAYHVRDGMRTAWDFTNDFGIVSLTPQEFFEVRYVLESLDDMSMFADVLKCASESDNVTVLISAVDALNYHLDTFNAIGATPDLFKSLVISYARIRTADSRIDHLITSLLEVGVRIPTEAPSVAMLRRDQMEREKQLSMEAPSPVSDDIADINTATPSRTFRLALDQLLASGNTMDEVTMTRIFTTLSKRLEYGSVNGKQCTHETARYFVRLRPFNTKLFDRLMIRWVITVLKSSPRPNLSSLLPPLIGVGCVALQSLYVLIKYLLRTGDLREGIPDLTEFRQSLIQLLDKRLANASGAQDLVAYRFKMAQQEYVRLFPSQALSLLQDLLAGVSQAIAESPKRAGGDPLGDSVKPLLSEIAVRHPHVLGMDGSDRLLEKFPDCMKFTSQALSMLLTIPDGSVLDAAKETIASINDFSRPFCLMKLRLLFVESDVESKKRIYDLVYEAAKSDIQQGLSDWIHVVSTLHADAAMEIRQRAEEQLLAITFTSLIAPRPALSSPTEPDAIATSDVSPLVYLRIVEELSFSILDAGNLSLGPVFVDKMNIMLQKITALENSILNTDSSQDTAQINNLREAQATQEISIRFWLYIMLRLIAIHRSDLDPSTLSKSDIVDQTRLLISISCIALSQTISSTNVPSVPLSHSLTNISSQATNNLQTQALDVAATLVDTIPDEARHQCARFFRDRCPPYIHPQNQPRLLFLFGPIPPTDIAASFIPPKQPTQSSPASGAASSIPAAAAGSSPTSTPAAAKGAEPAPTPESSQTLPTPPNSNYNAPSVAPSHMTPTTSISSFQPLPTPPSSVYNATLHIPCNDPNSFVGDLRLQQQGQDVGPYPLRPWEMLEESAPVMGVNDTAVNLGLFEARVTRD
ncbi:hypothetical protein ACO22_06425 [Paracoccidioides brasiliensis]|uniref:Mediator of RNA polymerase II transcription subunit 12 n=1 Tax=Paracoccidioides brasiliensis TaxID=121759 RepID=A0A1D2J7H6_PARBR|nr:hypothetical protein ACO22_06425 [Paracoccidioides brasiliensis]